MVDFFKALKRKQFIDSIFINDFFTGVGSRKTPKNILELMELIGYTIAVYSDKILVSGGAIGADSAFETGAKEGGGRTKIFYAKDCTKEAQELSKSFLNESHWNNLNDYQRKLMGRNSQQVLGRHLNSRTSFVICWTPEGKSVGGTKIAINLALSKGIPVYNLFFDDVKELFINGLDLSDKYLPF